MLKRRTRIGPCLDDQPHDPHEFYPGFFTRKQVCNGIYLHVDLVPHKHNLKLTRWTWDSVNQHGLLSPETVLSFTCRDYCADPSGLEIGVFTIKRWEYNAMVLNRSEVQQTWPQ